MNELNILDDLRQAVVALHIPAPQDFSKPSSTGLSRHATHQWRIRDLDGIKGLVWHQELGWSSVEGVAAYHTGPKSHLREGGVDSIAYTWAIRRNGQIVLCLPFEAKPWSQGDRHRPGDENAEFMSVMLEGLFDGPGVKNSDPGEPTQEQLLSALILWRVCSMAWGWDRDDLYGHYHFGKPSCPGFTGQDVIEAFRKCPIHRLVKTEQPVEVDYDFSKTVDRQRALFVLDYLGGEADGIWGVMSKGALVVFQQAVGLVADGVWGKNTEQAMVRALTQPKEYDLSTLKGLQEALIDLRILDGKADGIWGALSQGALVTFQEKVGLEPDGAMGPLTEKAILAELAKEA